MGCSGRRWPNSPYETSTGKNGRGWPHTWRVTSNRLGGWDPPFHVLQQNNGGVLVPYWFTHAGFDQGSVWRGVSGSVEVLAGLLRVSITDWQWQVTAFSGAVGYGYGFRWRWAWPAATPLMWNGQGYFPIGEPPPFFAVVTWRLEVVPYGDLPADYCDGAVSNGSSISA